MCGAPYRGVEERRVYTTRISPAAVRGVLVDLTTNTLVIWILLGHDYCGPVGAFLLFWWTAFMAIERAGRLHMGAANSLMVRVTGYRVGPPRD